LQAIFYYFNDRQNLILLMHDLGDIFEREEDIEQPEIWRSCGSVNPEQQENSRAIIANIADYIVPGHGSIFKVTDAMKKKLSQNVSTCNS
jgi:hypothetical protein